MAEKFLIIVESPTKAKTISKFLGHNFLVRSSMGHLRDLPKSQLGVDVKAGFEPKYITIRGKGEVVKELREVTRKVSRVLLASDPDREGEAIAWHLTQLLGMPEREPCRIEFHEITKNAVVAALKEPRLVNQSLVEAQQTRRVLDRLVGYSLSPLLWRKVRKGLSAGRVQSVAVRLICDREAEINAFVSEEYWTITANLTSIDRQEVFHASLVKRGTNNIKLSNQTVVEEILEQLKQFNFQVKKVTKKEKRRSAHPPFITSTLQQEAYRKLNFPTKKTMRIAQELYEGVDLGPKEGASGLITYIRTDSTRIADIAITEVRNYIRTAFGDEFVPFMPNSFRQAKTAQGAHEAIRPTSVSRSPDIVKPVLTTDQYKLYRLIWERFVASQMSPAVYNITTVEVVAGQYLFRATGSQVIFPGFTRLYTEGQDVESKEETQILPDLVSGEHLNLLGLKPAQHFTQPPPRFSDASLVKSLEELGIGRPSTYAPILETIIQRGYVTRKQKQIHPTELGQTVTAILQENFPDIIDVEFTASLEGKLDLIEEGAVSWRAMLEEFYRPFEVTLKKAEDNIEEVTVPDEVTSERCEHCGRQMVIKNGRFGKFLACPGYPECRNTRPLLENIGVSCPECGGEIVVRKSKRGRVFYGCSNYPRCNYVSWERPSALTCPDCGTRLVEKRNRKGLRLFCSRKGCSYESPGKIER